MTITEDFDENGVIRDGGRIHVSLFAMDHVQRALAQSAPQVCDAFGAPAGSRPGYVFMAGPNSTAARDAAFDAEGRRLAEAWRTQPGIAHVPIATLGTANCREAAYAARDAWLRDAWRTAR